MRNHVHLVPLDCSDFAAVYFCNDSNVLNIGAVTIPVEERNISSLRSAYSLTAH